MSTLGHLILGTGGPGPTRRPTPAQVGVVGSRSPLPERPFHPWTFPYHTRDPDTGGHVPTHRRPGSPPTRPHSPPTHPHSPPTRPRSPPTRPTHLRHVPTLPYGQDTLHPFPPGPTRRPSSTPTDDLGEGSTGHASGVPVERSEGRGRKGGVGSDTTWDAGGLPHVSGRPYVPDRPPFPRTGYPSKQPASSVSYRTLSSPRLILRCELNLGGRSPLLVN